MRRQEGLTVLEYIIGLALLVLALNSLFSPMSDKLNNALNNAISSINVDEIDSINQSKPHKKGGHHEPK